MTPLDFVWKHLGSTLISPGGFGGQCTDLANLWLAEAYGAAHVYANAVDWERAQIPRFAWERNTPTNMPPAGALVVWGPMAVVGVGEYGHIALALAADVRHFLSLDQNWPEGAPASVRVHDYRGVRGWHKFVG